MGFDMAALLHVSWLYGNGRLNDKRGSVAAHRPPTRLNEPDTWSPPHV